ncbi:hypothetical protein BN988_01896 [Oceanobacillus picturae]|uniref:Lipoprotein n=2 Tax=Oceanobacillus picturae TaxID=171693 RepID=W9ACC2_9BACI|nr:hypothetical protein BN988_01896 [Oceanobacillus picturae]
MMKKRFLLLSFFLVLFLSACNGNDELAGKTFKLGYPSVDPNMSIEGDADDPDNYASLLTVEFLDEKTFTSSIQNGEGTYVLNDNVLLLHFKNDNEILKLSFKIKESEKDFSTYAAEVSDADFEMTNADAVSHFKNLFSALNNDTYVEFIEVKE